MSTYTFENVRPMDIERRSFEIIGEELAEMGITLDPEKEPIIKRCIHTAADFDYAKNLVFSEGAVEKGIKAFTSGCSVITDTMMAYSGINKKAFGKFGGTLYNFMSDEDVAAKAKELGETRASVCMDKAAAMGEPLIYVIGNAPTALIRIRELYDAGKINPALVIGVPVGFVNVEFSKELIIDSDMPYIVARGRKGGSNVAAAICNALMYMGGGR
ncbi:MAG: precorrin-8X methylmutase [Lachnospiraceae bacterium]|nr:precorrin-8X methylmutase [Lachnospiraceae bacterium]